MARLFFGFGDDFKRIVSFYFKTVCGGKVIACCVYQFFQRLQKPAFWALKFQTLLRVV